MRGRGECVSVYVCMCVCVCVCVCVCGEKGVNSKFLFSFEETRNWYYVSFGYKAICVMGK